MRAWRLLAALGLTAAALAACSPAERSTTLAACQNDPGKLAASPNCVNAQAADADAHSKNFYTVQKPAARVQQPAKL
jgi:hypothetical protein